MDTIKLFRDCKISDIQEKIDYIKSTYNELPLSKRDLDHIVNNIIECNLKCDTLLLNTSNIDDVLDDRHNNIVVYLRDFCNSNSLLGSLAALNTLATFIDCELNKSLTNINSLKYS